MANITASLSRWSRCTWVGNMTTWTYYYVNQCLFKIQILALWIWRWDIDPKSVLPPICKKSFANNINGKISLWFENSVSIQILQLFMWLCALPAPFLSNFGCKHIYLNGFTWVLHRNFFFCKREQENTFLIQKSVQPVSVEGNLKKDKIEC